MSLADLATALNWEKSARKRSGPGSESGSTNGRPSSSEKRSRCHKSGWHRRLPAPPSPSAFFSCTSGQPRSPSAALAFPPAGSLLCNPSPPPPASLSSLEICPHPRPLTQATVGQRSTVHSSCASFPPGSDSGLSRVGRRPSPTNRRALWVPTERQHLPADLTRFLGQIGQYPAFWYRPRPPRSQTWRSAGSSFATPEPLPTEETVGLQALHLQLGPNRPSRGSAVAPVPGGSYPALLGYFTRKAEGPGTGEPWKLLSRGPVGRRPYSVARPFLFASFSRSRGEIVLVIREATTLRPRSWRKGPF